MRIRWRKIKTPIRPRARTFISAVNVRACHHSHIKFTLLNLFGEVRRGPELGKFLSLHGAEVGRHCGGGWNPSGAAYRRGPSLTLEVCQEHPSQ